MDDAQSIADFQHSVLVELDELTETEKELRKSEMHGFAALLGGTVGGGTGAASGAGWVKTILLILACGFGVWGFEKAIDAVRSMRKGGPELVEKKKAARKAQKRKKEKFRQVTKEAQSILKDSRVIKIVCPALQSGVNDVYDIARRITPVVVPLAYTGTLIIPLSPVLVAAVSLMIARMGVAVLCGGLKTPSE